jgi:hypothetical protein
VKEKLPEQGIESPFKRFERLAKQVVTTPKPSKKQDKLQNKES